MEGLVSMGLLNIYLLFLKDSFCHKNQFSSDKAYAIFYAKFAVQYNAMQSITMQCSTRQSSAM